MAHKKGGGGALEVSPVFGIVHVRLTGFSAKRKLKEIVSIVRCSRVVFAVVNLEFSTSRYQLVQLVLPPICINS